MSHALGVKLNLSFVQSRTCNVAYDELYEQAVKDGVTEWVRDHFGIIRQEMWPEWIENYMDAHAK